MLDTFTFIDYFLFYIVMGLASFFFLLRSERKERGDLTHLKETNWKVALIACLLLPTVPFIFYLIYEVDWTAERTLVKGKKDV